MLDLNTHEISSEPPLIQLNTIQINQEQVDFRAPEAQQRLIFSDVAPFFNYPNDLELPHNLNHLTFNFSAIDWTAPQGIGYQYILVGLDKQWSRPGKENKAEYRNIPPGKYIFQVRAKGKANAWSETFEYPFTILRPWWSRWWTFSIYGLILLLLARYYIKFIISRERIKAEIQIKQVEVDKMHELDQMKSRFFANISHEFRTPLTLIQGPVNDLLKRRESVIQADRKLLSIIKRNAGRLQQLISQLLDLSRLETGKLKLEVTEGDLTGLIRSIVLSFLSLAESKKINYSYELDESSLPLLFDRDKIEKILTNLVSNALKFTPEGGSVRVTLKYIQDGGPAPGSSAEIRVKDTGPGIPDEQMDKIFDRFYQVSGSDSHVHEGTGIGLALVKELVELYRGEILVESAPGKGSTFIVDLPVSREQFEEAELIPSPGKDMETALSEDPDILEYREADTLVQTDQFNKAMNDKHVILIVEDNPDLRDYIAQNLLSNYQILQAENGNEGLQKAIESIPDLVISDLMMPKMDGIEMCKLLKADHRTNHIPLIMLTAIADRNSKLESLETGADDFILKPFDAEELVVRVKNLIDQRKKLRDKFRRELMTEPEGIPVISPEDRLLNKVLEMCDRHLADSDFNIDGMSGNLNMSRTQLYRKIHAITGHAPMELLQTIRLKKAASLLESGERNISQVAYQVGFNNMSYFAKCFRRLYGVNPSEHLKSRN